MNGTLKEEALLERIGELTVSYENRIADIRVELTEYANEVTRLRNENETLQASLAEMAGTAKKVENPNEPVDAEVVEDDEDGLTV